MRLTPGMTHALALFVLAVFTVGPTGCVFLSSDYPCEESLHCPAPMICVLGTCVDHAAAPAEDAGAPQEERDGGDEPQPDPVDAGASLEVDAGPDEEPPTVDSGPTDPDPEPEPEPDPTPDPDPDPLPVAPIAVDRLVSATGPIVIELPVVEGDVDSFSILSAPRAGTLTPPQNGVTTYTPSAGFVGTDRFTWSASGEAGASVADVYLELKEEAPKAAAIVRLPALDQPSDAPRPVLVTDKLIDGATAAAALQVVDLSTGDDVAVDVELSSAGTLLWMQAAAETPLEVSVTGDAPDTSSSVFEDYDAVFHLFDGADATAQVPGTPIDTETVAGMCGDAQRFDGLGAHVDLGDDLPLLVGAEGATVSAWIMPSVLDSDGVILALATGNPNDGDNESRLQVGLAPNGRVEVLARASDGSESWRLESASDTLTGEAWQHVAVTASYDGDDVDLYIDGEPVGLQTVESGGQGGPSPSPVDSFSGASTSSTAARRAAIGAQDNGNSDHYTGLIDELRVAPTALSSAEVAGLYEATQVVDVDAGPSVKVAESQVGEGAISLHATSDDATLYLLAVGGQQARAAEVSAPGLSFIPLSVCTEERSVKLWWASGSGPVDGPVEVDAPGQVTAALLEVRDAVATTLAARQAWGEQGCAVGGSSPPLLSAGLTLDVMPGASGIALPEDAERLVDVGELLIGARRTPAAVAPTALQPVGVAGGLMVGVR